MKTASRILSAWLLAATAWASFAADQPYTIVGTGQTSATTTAAKSRRRNPDSRSTDRMRNIRRRAELQGQRRRHRHRPEHRADVGEGARGEDDVGRRRAPARWPAGSGGHADWRMPTIKELYSLINFTGGSTSRGRRSTPYLDTRFFDLRYGDESQGRTRH